MMHRLLRRDDGVAGMEFALLAPILVSVLFALIDLSMAAYTRREAQAAAQAGVQYAMISGWEEDEIEAAVLVSARLASPTVVAERLYGCALSSGLSFVAKGTNCTGGGVAGTYVRVSVTPSYEPILPFDGLSVGTTSAVVRIE
jgi:Flp pilus assembly protein TadG